MRRRLNGESRAVSKESGVARSVQATTGGETRRFSRGDVHCARLLSIIAGIFCLSLCGCGGGGSSARVPTPQISVAISQAPPASVPLGGAAFIAATVTNDPVNAGVNWNVECSYVNANTGTSECGTVTGHTASGANATYTAPSNSPGGPTTIYARSATNSAVAATATVNIPGNLSISWTQPPPSNMQATQLTYFTATIAGAPFNLLCQHCGKLRQSGCGGLWDV